MKLWKCQNQRNHNLLHFPLELRQARTLSSSVTLACDLYQNPSWGKMTIGCRFHLELQPLVSDTIANFLLCWTFRKHFVQYFMKWLAQIQSKIWNSSNCTSFIRLPGLNMLMFSKNVLTSFSNTFLTLEIKIKLNFSLRPWLEREGSSFRTLDLGNSWVLLTKRLSCKRYSQYMILGKKIWRNTANIYFTKQSLVCHEVNRSIKPWQMTARLEHPYQWKELHYYVLCLSNWYHI